MCDSRLIFSAFPPAKAEEVLKTAYKDLTVTDGRRSVAGLAQLIARDSLECPARLDYIHLAIVIDQAG